MTQPTLTNLAQRGAKCKSWAEWCRNVLATTAWKKINDSGTEEWEPEMTREWRRGVLDSKDWAYQKITIHGPLPSCTYLDDQLGEFLEKAGFDVLESSGVPVIDLGSSFFESYCAGIGIEVLSGKAWPTNPSPLDKLEAAITIVERAHRIGEYAHYTESEAAPYMVAFLRGIGNGQISNAV